MEFVPAVKHVFQNYANASGRAPRSEYWYFYLFYMLAILILSFIDTQIFGMFAGIFDLAVFIPFICVSIRRLHDLDRNGWWLLMLLIPLIGPIILIVWYCRKGTDGDNRFGIDPLGPQDA